MPRFRASRNADFGALQETFLVTAAATILIIRTDLWLTNYPQIGGNGLHIAHLLWGGLFMVAAIGALVTFLGRPSRRTATVIGGIGFGMSTEQGDRRRHSAPVRRLARHRGDPERRLRRG
jgi:hypothetical protein